MISNQPRLWLHETPGPPLRPRAARSSPFFRTRHLRTTPSRAYASEMADRMIVHVGHLATLSPT